MRAIHSIGVVGGLALLWGATGALASEAGQGPVTQQIHLDSLTVTAKAEQSLTTPSYYQAKQKLKSIPGNTSLVGADEYRQGSTGNLKDTVSYVPGVYAQNLSGPGTRLSIRGSGISIPWVIKGVTVLRSGMPLNEADGWYHSQLVDPLTNEYVEVYPGANALKYGAASLGGAINFVPYTGYTAAPLSASLEAGSHGYKHLQAASGKVLDHGWDYYGSLSGYKSNGWRPQQATDSGLFYGNLGHREDNTETRLHLNIAQSKQQLPGALTKKQLRHKPRQATAGNTFATSVCSSQDASQCGIPFAPGISNVYARAENRFDRYRLGLQHTRHYNAKDQLEVSVFAATQQVHHPLPFVVLEKRFQNYGTSLRGVNHFTLGNFANKLVWGGTLQYGRGHFQDYTPAGLGKKGALEDDNLSNATTASLYFEDHFLLTDDLTLVAGSQFAYAKRRTRIQRPGNPDANPSQSWQAASPKVGLVWQTNQAVQLYGNVSRSFEPPVLYEFNNAYLAFDHKLDAQTGTSYELGMRGKTMHWQWQLAAYSAQLHHEVMNVNHAGQDIAFNADDTRHQGIGLGLDGRLPLNWIGQDDLHLRLAYTLNRFTFSGDDRYHHNKLPGIPRQFARVALLYEQLSGFYAGPTLETASAYYVDYANSLKAGSYTIFGAKVGYRAEHWDLYLEALNLDNRHYAASSEVATDAGGADGFYFNPGRPRTVMAGIRFRL